MTATKEPQRTDVQATGETDTPTLLFVEETAAPEHFNIMLYGQMGSGKSTAAVTAPGPILYINAQGPNALGYPRKTARERGTRIMELRIDRKVQPDVREQLREVIRYVRAGTEPRPASVVVDTVHNLREALADQLVVPGARDTQRQWGDVAKALKGFVLELRDLPVNQILLAHEDIMDADGDRIIRPLIASSGALPEQIPAEMDIVAYCIPHKDEDGQTRYYGQLVEGRGRRAKDRSGGLGAMRELDLTEWLAAYREALGVTPLPWDENPADLAPEDETLALDLPEAE